jgi:ATP-binding cassette subfamily B protein
MESATMLSVVAISSFMYIKNNNAVISALPLMGVVILGAQKLLPMMQQIYSGFISLKSARSSLQEMMEIIAYEIEVYKTIKPSFRSINFNHELSLNFGSFTYENNKVKTINGVNLKIRSGQKVGIIGKSGSGKSTLLDVLMGLIPLQVGTLEIDGIVIDKDNVHLWQKIIAHVPQTIFLVDASVEQNIAFGVDVNKINAKRMQDAIEKAQLSAVISKLCMGIKTEIGERGVALSGGERQRIGIARAIYKGAKILFLDEATNALDDETEVNVIQALEGIVGLTLIMVAHRKSTLAKCDVLYLVDNGHVSVLK